MTIDYAAATDNATRSLCQGNGQVAYGPALVELERRLDNLFLRWASDLGATEYRFPATIPAAALARAGYLSGFPHLATFPVSLDPSEANLRCFADTHALDAACGVRLTRTSPVTEVLTPAACYHCYLHWQTARLETPLYITTRGTCFRREQSYAPLQRQSAFTMREIVCIGSPAEVRGFLARCARRVRQFTRCIGLPLKWLHATDPFFNPMRQPGYILQKSAPLKTEMVYSGGLAIGSLNLHRDHFGRVFDIERAGQIAHSGCIAFGLERWMHAVLHRFGTCPEHWPRLFEECGSTG